MSTEPSSLQAASLHPFEERIYSQGGEDGIIREVLKRIGTDSRYAVEFGVEDGTECNTRLLKEAGWEVLQMDGRANDPRSIKREFITAENINGLFEKYGVPENLDVLSIDIDFNDFWVWRSIESKYRARMIVIEYNASFPADRAVAVRYNSQRRWDGGSDYWGASLMALYNLGRTKGYELVYCDKRGVNAFFVRSDLVSASLPARTPTEVFQDVGYGTPMRSRLKPIELTAEMYVAKPRTPYQIRLSHLRDRLCLPAALAHRALIHGPYLIRDSVRNWGLK